MSQEQQEKSKERSILKAFILLSLLILALFFGAPFLLNNSDLKTIISQKVAKDYGANLSINGKVKIALLPYPAIIVQDVLLQNLHIKSQDEKDHKIYNFYAKEVLVRFPIINFSNDSAIRDLTFREAKFESYDAIKQPEVRQNDLTKIIDDIVKNPKSQVIESGDGIALKIFSSMNIDLDKIKITNTKNLILEDSDLIFYDYLGRQEDFKKLSLKLKFSDKKITASGNFSRENLVNDFKVLLNLDGKNGKPNSSFEISSPILSLRLVGNISAQKMSFSNINFLGRMEAEILDLKSFYKSYVSAKSFFSNKLKQNSKSIKLSADINKKGQEIEIDNLNFSSALFNGTASIDLDLSNKIPLANIAAELTNLNLDEVWSNDEVAPEEGQNEVKADLVVENVSQNQEVKKENSEIIPIHFSEVEKIKDFDLTADIKVNSVKYFGDEITNAELYLDVSSQGEILIQPLIFKIPGQGEVRLSGVFDNSTKLPKFIGKVDAKGKKLLETLAWLKVNSSNLKLENLQEYSLYCDILTSLEGSSFGNIYINLGEGKSEIVGEIKVTNSGKYSNAISNFSVSQMRMEDIFADYKHNIYLAPGSLIKKLFWLNEISANHELNINFDKILFKEEVFSDQKLKFKFGRGYFELSNLDLKSNNFDLKAALSVDISEDNPKFNLNLSSNNLVLKTAENSQLQEDSLSKNNPVINSHRPENKNLFDQFFNLPSLESFNGKVDFDFKNLTANSLKIENFIFSSDLKEGNFVNADLACNMYGGSLSYKGLVGIKSDKTFNGSLTFDQVSLKPFLTDFLEIKNIDGTANISANLTSIADNKKSFASNLSSEIKFSVSAPSIDGYGLNDLVKKMFAKQLYAKDLQNPQLILLNSEAKTSFKQADGMIKLVSKKSGKIRVNASAPAVNAVLSGEINAQDKTIDSLFNVIFVTGNRQKQIPINIATSIKGQFGNFSHSTNIDQVMQYLGLEQIQSKVAIE